VEWRKREGEHVRYARGVGQAGGITRPTFIGPSQADES
jgi:hypothetical protein